MLGKFSVAMSITWMFAQKLFYYTGTDFARENAPRTGYSQCDYAIRLYNWAAKAGFDREGFQMQSEIFRKIDTWFARSDLWVKTMSSSYLLISMLSHSWLSRDGRVRYSYNLEQVYADT